MIRKPGGVKINSLRHNIERDSELTIKANALRLRPRNQLIAEHALVINLKGSTERLETFKRSYNFRGSLAIIDAVDGTQIEPSPFPHMKRGDLACLKSHRIALEYAKEENYPCVLIFEDDISFPADFNEHLAVSMSELPDNWDMLWLAGAQRFTSEPYSPRLKILGGCWGGYGYCLRNTVYDFFLDEFRREQQSCDTYYSTHQSKFNSFRTTPDLVTHIGRHSIRVAVNQQ